MELILIILEFVFIIVLQLLGIGFHVMQKVLIYDKQYPAMKAREIFGVFLDEDWSSLLISFLVLMTDVIIHLIIHIWFVEITGSILWNVPYLGWSFIIALILGYAGQRIAYKFLGKAADKLDQIADKIDTKPA